jgi:hypothetical protein
MTSSRSLARRRLASEGGRLIEGRYRMPSSMKSNWIRSCGAAVAPPVNHLLPHLPGNWVDDAIQDVGVEHEIHGRI